MTVARRTLVVLLALTATGLVGIAALLWHDGYRMYTVASGSMLPTYQVGDLVVTAPPPGTYDVGDVVTFPAAPGSAQDVTTHRVAEVTGPLLLTKGDANATVDHAPVPAADVVGHVVSAIPKAGYVVVFFQQPTGVPSLLTALLTMVALWGLFFPDEQAGDRRRRPPRARHALEARTG